AERDHRDRAPGVQSIGHGREKNKTTTILQFAGQAGCFLPLFNGILPALDSKIVDNCNISLN
ncbi:hypothetical protein, partial [Klebsiella quasivariicola]|uniref:hypothetical protein n=1 Tax=Klebsiella quasivariicola TaxID=2026240 RepID=UPI001C6FCB77